MSYKAFNIAIFSVALCLAFMGYEFYRMVKFADAIECEQGMLRLSAEKQYRPSVQAGVDFSWDDQKGAKVDFSKMDTGK